MPSEKKPLNALQGTLTPKPANTIESKLDVGHALPRAIHLMQSAKIAIKLGTEVLHRLDAPSMEGIVQLTKPMATLTQPSLTE